MSIVANRNDGRRLAAATAVAAVLHLLLLGLIRLPGRPLRAPAAEPLELRWTGAPPQRAAVGGTSYAARGASPTLAASPESAAGEQETGPPLATSLAETSRRLARSFAIEGRGAARASPDQPILPQLDRALRLEPAGEKPVAHNVLRVADGKGHYYCMKEAPEWMRDGPLPPHATQVNCP